MGSIRSKLLFGSVGAMVALLIASGIFLFFMVRKSLLDQFDEALVERAQAFASEVEIMSGKVVFDDVGFNMDEFKSSDGASCLEIRANGDDVLYRSPSLGAASLTLPANKNEKPKARWIHVPDGRLARAVRFDLAPAIETGENTESEIALAAARKDEIVLIFARDIAPVSETLGRLEIILLTFGTATILLAAALLIAVIKSALRPLDALAFEIGAIKPEDLAMVVAIDNCPDELRPVVNRLNATLARLKHAFDRERGFSADVAHELRTPLAGIRSTLEVVMSRPRSATEYEAALKQCMDIAHGMQAMVENLLTLARLDTGEIHVIPEEVALDAILESALAPMRAEFAARNIDVQWDVDRDLLIDSDPALLQIIARNVLDNALSYTDDGGRVNVSARKNGEIAELCVRNSGSQISPNQTANLFDRFWRADTARSGNGAHCGLGLSLVKKIVTTLGGTAEVSVHIPGVFQITITVPAAWQQ